ncbi:hypothetical protein [Candidatus Binatus sp.]|uniref:hypothetical protein n=1 Tax=Candidatus Binatus sp. TaxID=2811406 RepID=UPI003CC6D176
MISHTTLNEIIFVLGILFVIGAYRRWRWLVDPPIELSLYYSQAAMRHRFGETFTLYFTYSLGVFFVILGGRGSYLGHREQILTFVHTYILH